MVFFFFFFFIFITFLFRDVLVEQKHVYIHISTTGARQGARVQTAGNNDMRFFLFLIFFSLFSPFSFSQKSRGRQLHKVGRPLHFFGSENELLERERTYG